MCPAPIPIEWFPPLDILSDICSDILSSNLSDMYSESISQSVWHTFWHSLWHVCGPRRAQLLRLLLSLACYLHHLCFLSCRLPLVHWHAVSELISLQFAAFLSLSSFVCMLFATFLLLVDGHLFIDVFLSSFLYHLQHFWSFHISFAFYLQHSCFLSMAACSLTCCFWAHSFAICSIFWAFHLSFACYLQHLCFLSMATCSSTCCFWAHSFASCNISELFISHVQRLTKKLNFC
jgi:hypothetical protein